MEVLGQLVAWVATIYYVAAPMAFLYGLVALLSVVASFVRFYSRRKGDRRP